MRSDPSNSGSGLVQDQRRAVVLLAGMGGSLLVLTTLGLAYRLATGQGVLFSFVAGYLAAALAGTGAYLARQGKVTQGAMLAMVAVLGAIAVAITELAGLATLAVSLCFLIFAGIVSQTFPAHQVGRTIIVMALVSLALILLDVFWPGVRLELPAGAVVALAVIGITLLLAVGALLLRNFANFSLSTKLILSSLLLSLVPLGILALLNASTTRSFLIDDANRVLRSAAVQTANTIDRFLDEEMQNVSTEARILSLTAAPSLLSGEPLSEEATAAVLAHLATFRNKDPLHVKSYALLNLDGENVLDTQQANIGTREADRDYFREPLRNGFSYVSDISFDPADGEAVVYFATPVVGATGETVGILRKAYRASIIQELVSQNTGLVGGQSFGVVFDQNGLQIAHGRTPEAVYKTVGALPEETVRSLQSDNRLPPGTPSELSSNAPDLAEKLEQAGEEPFFSAPDISAANTVNRVAVVPLATLPWQIGFFQPQEVFLTPVSAQVRNTILLAAVIAALVTSVAVATSRFLVGPITTLTAAATRVAGGELGARAVIETRDEIGSLAVAFNAMADRLQETLGGLELRVQERTRALETSALVSHSVSTILEQEELVWAVVRQLYGAFDYYNVQIYLLDTEDRQLVLTAGTGRPGDAVNVGQRRLSPGEGLVGRAAFTRAAVLATHVQDDPDWQYDPALPETASELIVPIIIGDDLLGVLDVQQSEAESLTSDDIDILQSIANQIAVALRNARLYRMLRQQAEYEARLNTIAQRISATTTVKEALQVAARELGRATGGSEVYVRLAPEQRTGNGQEGNDDR